MEGGRQGCRSASGPAPDAPHGSDADLPAAADQRSAPQASHLSVPVYPYLLRDLAITEPDHVWCADITYLPMRRGFLYLVAIMDWASRKVLAWRLSNTLETDFCVEALEEAMMRSRRR